MWLYRKRVRTAQAKLYHMLVKPNSAPAFQNCWRLFPSDESPRTPDHAIESWSWYQKNLVLQRERIYWPLYSFWSSESSGDARYPFDKWGFQPMHVWSANIMPNSKPLSKYSYLGYSNITPQLSFGHELCGNSCQNHEENRKAAVLKLFVSAVPRYCQHHPNCKT